MTYVAFSIYPIIAILVFSRIRFILALPSVVLVGLLTLPSRFEIPLPALPDLNRETWVIIVTSTCAIAFANFSKQSTHQTRTALQDGLQIHDGWIPQSSLVKYLLPLAIVGPLGTWLTNQAPTLTGDLVFPGLGLTDFLVDFQSNLVFLCLFLVSWRYLGSDKAHQAILLSISVAGLIYTLPTLYEIRMSPQIHVMIYGYFPHSFHQHMRGGGFRPLVLMPHALELAAFLCLAALATIAYMRTTQGDRRVLYFLCALWVILVLVAGRSVGAALVACTILPVAFFGSARLLVLFAALVALVVLLYPAQRAVGFSPMQYVANVVQTAAPERAGSLEFRLNAEDIVLQRSLEKPLFGWGGWKRNEVFDEESGRDLTVFDGTWLIQFSRNGTAGFLLIFGLLTFPLLHLACIGNRVSLATAGVAILLAANLFDLIPNSSLSPITIMLAGALAGRLQTIAVETRVQNSEMAISDTSTNFVDDDSPPRDPLRYARTNATKKAQSETDTPSLPTNDERKGSPCEIDHAQVRYTRFAIRKGRNRN